MNIPLLIFGIVGVGVIFAIAAWAGPKVIRAMYPEEQHDSMIKAHRIMVIVAIVFGILSLTSTMFTYFANGT